MTPSGRSAAAEREKDVAPSGRRIATNAGFRLVADVGGKIASAALFVAMARVAGDAAFGIYSFALAFVTIVTLFGEFGQDLVLAREVARVHGRVRVYFGNTLLLRLTLSLPILAVSMFIAALAGVHPFSLAVIGLLGCGTVADLLSKVCFAIFQAYERLGLLAFVLIAQRWLTAVLGVTALLVYDAGIATVAAIYAIVAVLAFGVAAWLLVSRIVAPGWEVSPSRWPGLMRAAAPVGLSGMFYVILFRADASMLALWEPPQVVGHYSAAYRLLETVQFLAWAVAAGFYPVFARLSAHSSPPVTRYFERAIKAVLVLGLPTAVGAAVLARPLILTIFGPQFAGSIEAMRLLAPAIALYPLTLISANLLIAQDRQWTMTWLYGIVALENILLNLFLIPAFSLNGAAFGTTLSEVLLAGGAFILASRAAGGARVTRAFTGACAGGLASGAAMALASNSLIVGGALGLIVYTAVLLAVELRLYPEDVRALVQLVRASI